MPRCPIGRSTRLAGLRPGLRHARVRDRNVRAAFQARRSQFGYTASRRGPMQPVGAMAAATERYQKARITWRRDHAPDLWSIRIRPEQKLLFKPGQYATIGVERDGR